jgi:hypothetical protein
VIQALEDESASHGWDLREVTTAADRANAITTLASPHQDGLGHLDVEVSSRPLRADHGWTSQVLEPRDGEVAIALHVSSQGGLYWKMQTSATYVAAHLNAALQAAQRH